MVGTFERPQDLVGGLVVAGIGANLMMGGYGHSRLRETLLGGTTYHMLEHATLPVLLVH
jgi:hypothetical protein